MLNIRELSPALAVRAQNELNENPKNLSSDISALKEWLVKQPHIIPRTDDQFLVSFLRICKYSLERTKERLDMYFTVRTMIPEFFVTRDPASTKFREMYDTGSMIPLPKPQPDGSRIIINKFDYDPRKNHLTEFMDVALLITDNMFNNDDQSVICGNTVIADISNLSLAHIAHATPTLLQKMGHSLKEAYPSRQKGIHFIKPSAGFEVIFKMFQSFLSEKITGRLFVHSTLESLHQHVAKSHLPAEYGGDLGPLENIRDNFYKELLRNRQWFLDDMKYKTDESKRLGKPKIYENLFGVDGSFRKLEVD